MCERICYFCRLALRYTYAQDLQIPRLLDQRPAPYPQSTPSGMSLGLRRDTHHAAGHAELPEAQTRGAPGRDARETRSALSLHWVCRRACGGAWRRVEGQAKERRRGEAIVFINGRG